MSRKLIYTFSLIGFFLMLGVFGSLCGSGSGASQQTCLAGDGSSRRE